MKFPALYGISLGTLMIAQRTFSIISGGVPEFQTAPWAIAFHLAAEMSTALVLIIGGLATLKSISWGKMALLTGPGMVIYSQIVSPGYYAQQDQWLFVGMFGIVLFGAVVGVMQLLREKIN